MRRPLLRRLGMLGAGLLGVLVLAFAWFSYPRSPAPPDRFDRQRGTLVEASVVSTSREAGDVYEEILLRNDRGITHRALVRVPQTTRPSLTIVLMGGLHTGRNCIRYAPEMAEPVVWASIDYPVVPDDDTGLLDLYAELETLRLGVHQTVGGLSLLLDHLEGRPEVDASRTVLAGGSLGSFVSPMAGAREKRFEAVVLFGGGAGLGSIVEHNLPLASRWSRKLVAGSLNPWLGPFDPGHYVSRISPRPLLVIGQEQDRLIPRENVLELHALAREPRTLVWLDVPHKVQGNEEITELMARAVGDWIQQTGF